LKLSDKQKRKGVFEMLDITNLYIYRIVETAVGIVKADSEIEAREKVRAAYSCHYGNEYAPEMDTIDIKKITNDSWFSDHPDVIEIDELV
jgi:hypothetical protein